MKTTRAFTLIELLVVIAVIAVLMGILMPALSAARRQAWSTVCKNNLRSTMMAMALYAEDNDYVIPRGVGGNPKKEDIWFLAFMPYLAHEKDKADYRDVDAYRCPAYPDKRQTVCFVINAYHPEKRSGNTEWLPQDGRFRLTKYKRLSETIYLADNEDGIWRPVIETATSNLDQMDIWESEHMANGRDGGAANDNRSRRVARKRHGRGYNAAFADTHVELMKTLTQDDSFGSQKLQEIEIKQWIFHR